MRRKTFFTGSVFQFYVAEIEKFAFCAFFDFTNVSKFEGLIVQVFDRFSDKEENQVEDLNSSDWLFGPRVTQKWPDLRKNTSWKSLGILMPTKENFIPDFKGVQAFPYVVENESIIGPWYPIHGLVKRGENCKYEQVKHLEQQILTTSLGFEARTGMEYCRVNGFDVASYYNLKELRIRNMYLQMINIPIYKNITEAIRGKAVVDL
jgi:hypothetical protein